MLNEIAIMGDSEAAPHEDASNGEEKKSKRSRMKMFFKQKLSEATDYSKDAASRGVDYSKESLIKGVDLGKAKLQQAVGLGKTPNVVPDADADISGEPRKVEIGWHPVGGFAGKWFAEQTGLGKMITEGINKYPDPTQHWAVLVGDYGHQLWMDENLDVIYNNEKLNREEWHTFEVGQTRFNDEALRQAAEMTIFNMREKRAAYNLISNNCQNFATLMLEAIQVGAHKRFATSFSVYQAATGSGRIKDLFVPDDPNQEQLATGAEPPESVVQHAQQVMDDNTAQMDSHAVKSG